MSYFAVGAISQVTLSPQALVDVARSSTRVVATKPGDCPSGTGTGYVLDAGGFWRRARCGEVGQAAPPGAHVVDQRPPTAAASVLGLPTTTLALIGGVGALAVVVLLRRRRKAQP